MIQKSQNQIQSSSSQPSHNIQNVRAFKFSFDIILKKINIAISFPCKIQVIAKRGTQKVESNQFDLINGVVTMSQTLNLQTNLYLDVNSKAFLDKKATFTVLLITPKGQKVAGTCSADIASYAKNQITYKDEQLKLEKCPDKQAMFSFGVKVAMLGEVEFDSMSTVSTSTSHRLAEEEGEDGNKQNKTGNGVHFSELSTVYESKNEEKGNDSRDDSKHNSNNSSEIKVFNSSSVNNNNEKEVIQKLERKIEELQKNLQTREEQNSKLLKEKQQQTKGGDSVREENEQMKKNNQLLLKQVEEKNKTIGKQSIEIQELSKQVQNLQSELLNARNNDSKKDQSKGKSEDQSKVIDQLQLEIKSLKQSTDEQIRIKVNEANNKQQQKIKELSLQLQEEQDKNKSLLAQSVLSKQDSSSANSQKIKSLEQELLQAKNDLKNAKEELNIIDIIQLDLVRQKQKIGDIYNRAMEIGGVPLYEELCQM